MDHRVAARDQELGDQPPVAARPERLGAHEARRRLGQRFLERLLPGLGAHPRRVAAERTDPEAAELLLARLPAAAAAELDRVPVGDPRLAQRLSERRLPELRIPPRAGKPADVHERLDGYLT